MTRIGTGPLTAVLFILGIGVANASECGAPDAENLDYLKCQSLLLWDSAEAKKATARQYLESAEKIRQQCQALEARADQASCSMKSMDYEVEAGFLIQESKSEAQQAEVLANEYWRLKDGVVPTDDEQKQDL